jgi:predicted anti-sigma-YlaC factor YlaD
MKCDRYKEDRILYIYGELKGRRKKSFKEHLSSCPYCKKYIEDFQSALSLYSRLPNKEPTEKTVRRILKRAKRVHIVAPCRERSVVTRRVRWAIPAFAGAVALFLLLILPHSDRNTWEDNFEETVWHINQEVSLLIEYETLNYSIDTRIQEIKSELSVWSDEW